MREHDPSPEDDVVLPVERADASRRSFLKLVGFGVASATIAGCTRAPTNLVVPRLDSGGFAPGQGYWIATTCGGCEARCGVLARCRDGRPIKLEGNPEHALSNGGLCAVGQASVLDLYDGRRSDGPTLSGKKATWSELDTAVTAALGKGGGLRVLTRTVTSPSTRAWIERLTKKHGGEHVEWDPRSASALLDAHAAALGVRAVPRMHFDRARVIASFDADFLGTWLSPVEFARAYRDGRRPDGESPGMSRHVQIESRLSLTGGSADQRLSIAPREMRNALQVICGELAKHANASSAGATVGPKHDELVALAADLWEARGESLVVCGSDDPGMQALAVQANQLLGNYGKTLDLAKPSLARRGDDGALAKLIDDVKAGSVGVLLVDGLDPVYELPDDAGFQEALGNGVFLITTAPRTDQTTELAQAVAPIPHELESWNDAEAAAGHLSLSQPTVPPLRNARTLRNSLANWLGEPTADRELLRAHWKHEIHKRVMGSGAFDDFFDDTLRRGHVAASVAVTKPKWNPAGVRASLASTDVPEAPAGDDLALVLYSKVGLPEGRDAHNPWLQELPDPLTTVAWDNYACIAPATAEKRGLTDGDVVKVSSGDGGASIELPVRVVPGTHERVVAIAVGYGVTGTDRFSRIGPSWLEGRLTVREGETVGTRAAALLGLADGALRWNGAPATLSATGANVELAATQDHHTMEVPKHLAVHGGARRDLVLATTFDKLQDDPAHAIKRPHVPEASLWPADHENDGPRWGLAIDLSACNGCSGCVVACQAENNVPVVGKDEIARHREMTWLRIDRYFDGEGDDTRLYHQPVMCQHCANAPCETVCPVLATVHSKDGLNQQVYNRCVGTRYCANNCPYKTRRFNWFDYPRREELRNLALNPDVTVRSRGVMEKCSMCVQRIQEGKFEAKRTGTPLADGTIQTACQQSCPAGAIVFGDLNDPESEVAQLAHGARAYHVLGELNVQPGVTYLAAVHNAPAAETGGRHE